MRADGGVSLHTRNLKYGKLSNGSLVRVPSNLIKRCKQHFQQLGTDIGVEVILGLNGFVWVQEAPVEKEKAETDEATSSAAAFSATTASASIAVAAATTTAADSADGCNAQGACQQCARWWRRQYQQRQ